MAGKRVLLIDNDPFSLSVLHRLLSELGHEPLVGTNRTAVEALLQGGNADAIVYNQDLDAEWGISLLRRVRGSATTANLPVILLTQMTMRLEPRVEQRDATTVCFRKPIAIEPFVTIFRMLVDKGRPAGGKLPRHPIPYCSPMA